MLQGMVSTPAAVGSAGTLSAIQAQLAAMSAANAACSSMTIPPGLDGASARAVVQQLASAASFEANFLTGIEQMAELSATLVAASAAYDVHDAAGVTSITNLL